MVDTPFHPQSRYQCGPASLATILLASGVDVGVERLTNDVFIPGRKGSLQLEMVAATRQHGLLPYQPDSDFDGLMRFLNQGSPVLVLMNPGLRVLPVYHYAVLIGYIPAADQVILRSGRDYRLTMPRSQFTPAWDKAGKWSLVALRPGHIPGKINIDRYLESVMAMETIGKTEEAGQGYRALVELSPGNTLARFGLANTLYARGKFEQAVTHYGHVLVIDKEHFPARNNLADSLLKLGRCEQALAAISYDGDSTKWQSAVAQAFQQTRAEIEKTCRFYAGSG